MKSGDIEAMSRENEPTAFVPREEYDKVVIAMKDLIDVLELWQGAYQDPTSRAATWQKVGNIRIQNALELIGQSPEAKLPHRQ